MGKYNSSLTRVVPLLNFLQSSDNFPNNLISLVNNEYAITLSSNPATLRHSYKKSLLQRQRQ